MANNGNYEVMSCGFLMCIAVIKNCFGTIVVI